MRAVSGGAISFAPTAFLPPLKGAGKETICPRGAILASSPDASSFFSLALPGSSAAKKRRVPVV
jgi:hypothetical protein